MSQINQDIWLQAWSQATNAITDPLFTRPEELADRAFELFAGACTGGDPGSLKEVDPQALSKDCALLAALVRNVRPGFVKTVCFTTKGPQLDRLLLGIVFMAILVRLHDYRGPIAWLSFPATLLDDRFFNQISRTFSAIQAVPGSLGAPLEWASEPMDDSCQPVIGGSPPAVYVGATFPFSRDATDPVAEMFEAQYGLPMICIPSRATQGMIVQLSPTPFAHEGIA